MSRWHPEDACVGPIGECFHVVLLGNAERRDPGHEEDEWELVGRGRVAANMCRGQEVQVREGRIGEWGGDGGWSKERRD